MTEIPDGDGLEGLQVLRDYAYENAEEIFYAAQALGPELAELTGIAPVELQAKLAPMLALLPGLQQQALDDLACPLGVPTIAPPEEPAAAGPVPALPPAMVNHIPHLRPIRDQGQQRGTCVAQASNAVLEHALVVMGAPVDLSAQFLYWDCKQVDGRPDEPGTFVRFAFPLIARDGVCPEAVWPYDPVQGPEEDGGDPPAAAFAAALPYRHAITALPKSSLLDLKAAVARGRCVAFSVPVFRSWYRSTWVRNTGKINMPLPNDILDGAHAMTIVGYEDSSEVGTGGGRFILRNSWGRQWAPDSIYGAGYGSIPYAYIERHCMEAYTLR